MEAAHTDSVGRGANRLSTVYLRSPRDGAIRPYRVLDPSRYNDDPRRASRRQYLAQRRQQRTTQKDHEPSGAPLHTIFLRRKDGRIQRYKVRDPNAPGIVKKRESKAAFDKQQSRIKRTKKNRQAAPDKGGAIPKGQVPAHMISYRTFFRAQAQRLRDRDVPISETKFLLEEGPPGAPGAPGAFYSNAASLGGTGQVMWPRRVPLQELIDDLNFTLNLPDGVDFREVYPQWSYRYIVVEMFLGKQTANIVEEISDSRGD